MILKRVVLMLFGVALAGAGVGLFLILFPDLLPGGQRFVFRESDGDTFRHQPGFVRPPAEDRILESFIIHWDEAGFRRPRWVADHYPIVALGDSFTEGGEVPWVDVLAAALNIPVQNRGWRGFGPLQELEVLRHYVAKDTEWVLLAYFEGNDLSNIHSAYDEWEANAYISFEPIPPPPPDKPFQIVQSETGEYLYPLVHQIGDRVFELAYISDYLWWLNGERDVYERSRNMALLRDAFSQMREAMPVSCIALVYIPSKEHLYFPYADPAGNRFFVLQNSLALSLDGDGWLGFGGLTSLEDETLLSRLNYQRDVVAKAAEDQGILFFDLLPVFEEAVLESAPLYYTYDSHWNREGHRVAGEAIADYIREADCK